MVVPDVPPDLAPLTPVAALLAAVPQRGPKPTRAGLSLSIASLAAGAALGERARPHFPVRGPFNWGQTAASFGGGRSHPAQDIMSRSGTPVVAVRDAVVLETGNEGGRGNYVGLYDRAARKTYVYLHLLRPVRLRRGTHVMGGQRVGAVGCTGSCDGPHLHFELRDGRRLDGRPHDPRPVLARWARTDGIRASLPPGAG